MATKLLNKYPIVAVHGLFGWGDGELPINYWGNISENSPVPIFELSVGPVSSWHDRACEIIAQVKGLQVDYGEVHAKEHGHSRYGRNYSGCGVYPKWNTKNKLHFIGHSAGGNTMRMVQHLLEIDHYGISSSADWINSISAISSVLNGTPGPYILGCDRVTGKVRRGTVGRLFQKLVLFAASLQVRNPFHSYDFELDHWGFVSCGDIGTDIENLKTTKLFEGKDSLVYDLTFQGNYEFNGFAKSYPNTYYFGYATDQSVKIGKHHYPRLSMNKLMYLISVLSGRYNFSKSPSIPEWGTVPELQDAVWRANDGLVPVMSQYYPFINPTVQHKVASSKGISKVGVFEKGVWYYDDVQSLTGHSFDHMDIVCGAYLQPNLIHAQQQFYRSLIDRLLALP